MSPQMAKMHSFTVIEPPQRWVARRIVGRDRQALAFVFASVRQVRRLGCLASNEAAYWTWRAGSTPLSMFVRRSAPWQRLLWRVWPLALPRDRELATCRMAGSAG